MRKHYCTHAGRLCLLATLIFLRPFPGHSQWTLVWQDEFNGSIGPDWVFETGTGSGGWGNNELQYYRAQNASIENGALVITARNESYGGMNYTSARMKTQGKKSWRYGRIEARIMLPSFTGSWPAFWMLGDNISSVGWPACGEIDIMEHVNTEGSVHGTVHWQDHTNSYASYSGYTGTNVTGYHVYAIEWDASLIKWFVDGTLYHQINISGGVNGTSEFHNNFFIILNMAIGGNWPGFTVNTGALPAKMYVDYVRVYTAGSSSWSAQIEAENWAVMSGVQTEACSEGGQNVGWIEANDWIVWDVNVPSTGAYTVSYRVASPNSGGVLQLEKAGGSPVYGSLGIPNTGGWQNWTTVSHSVSLSAGQQQIAIKALAGGWNINWLKISDNSGSRMATSTPEALAEAKGKVHVYPNPTTDKLTLTGLENYTRVTVHDLAGNVVKDVKWSPDTPSLDVSGLRSGIYFLQVPGEPPYRLKFIKK